MTAEIALLNKSAVALAADSAATVSSRDRQEKVFNSEDKLFELSNLQPIGVMIFNSTTFMETPIHILIKKYRAIGNQFDTIDEAANHFRNYLRDFGNSVDQKVKDRNFNRLLKYPFDFMPERIGQKVTEQVTARDENNTGADVLKDFAKRMDAVDREKIYNECLDFYISTFSNAPRASFTGNTAIKLIDESTKTKAKTKTKTDNLGRLIEAFLKSSATSNS